VTQLLVSVRSVEEAELAARLGVGLIDVKEPRHGSLGAADDEVVRAIAQRITPRAALSVALGELRDRDPLCAGRMPPPQARFAKLGLSGCEGGPAWRHEMQSHVARWPVRVRPVAVVYADREAAQSPAMEEVLAAARGCRAGAVLVDTFDKRGGRLLDHWTTFQVGAFIEAAGRLDMLAVVAGSLDLDAIREILPLRPDVVAVRGAACQTDRDGALSEARVRQLMEVVDQGNALHRDAG
jgi:uncharacterized protein (UPF0264 family)